MRTYISKEEKDAQGFKATKDRLMHLLCGNTVGDCKLKLLLVHYSLTPHALKGLRKNVLPLHWTVNKKALVTGLVFEHWFTSYFILEAEHYCWEANRAFKVLFIHDNVPGHLKHLKNINLKCQHLFLLPNATSLIQPIDQGVIATFKAYYIKRTISQLLLNDLGSQQFMNDRCTM